MANKIADVKGQRFGLLKVIEPTDLRFKRKVVWRCECECGNETLATSDDLKLGWRKSCGCQTKRPLTKASRFK